MKSGEWRYLFLVSKYNGLVRFRWVFELVSLFALQFPSCFLFMLILWERPVYVGHWESVWLVLHMFAVWPENVFEDYTVICLLTRVGDWSTFDEKMMSSTWQETFIISICRIEIGISMFLSLQSNFKCSSQQG